MENKAGLDSSTASRLKSVTLALKVIGAPLSRFIAALLCREKPNRDMSDKRLVPPFLPHIVPSSCYSNVSSSATNKPRP